MRRLYEVYQSGSLWDPIEYTIDHSRKLVYLVISKVACSSIKAAFLEEEIPDNYSIHYTLTQKGFRKQGSELNDEEKTYFKFSFVRNPFDRIVSCYESKLRIDSERFNKNDFSNYFYGYIAKDEGFETFVEKICSIPSRFCDRHFVPQYLLLYDQQKNCRVDFIGHFETLEEGFKPIQEKYNLKPLGHYNNSGSRDYREYYTLKTARMIYRKYKKDIKTFGYEQSYRDLIAYIKKKNRTK
ncbi:MAG: sulfotransferase family 2 domain-containing protein [Solobacterium sp.]|nr:sulfotransferase family 2 domain-containing protein [Solobacterium sp.]